MARRFTSLIFSGKPERQKKFGVKEDGLPDGVHDDLESALILAGIRTRPPARANFPFARKCAPIARGVLSVGGSMIKGSDFDDARVPFRVKLSLLWAAVMFFYLYGDYFGLYVPGQLRGMLQGQGPAGPTSQGTLAIVSVLTVLPGLMVFLAIVLPSAVNRWLNFGMGLFYTLFVLMTLIFFTPWLFYLIYSLSEMSLTLSIAWFAWKWPRQAAA